MFCVLALLRGIQQLQLKIDQCAATRISQINAKHRSVPQQLTLPVPAITDPFYQALMAAAAELGGRSARRKTQIDSALV